MFVCDTPSIFGGITLAGYNNSTSAYDFNRFDPARKREQPQSRPTPRVVQPKRRTREEIRAAQAASYRRAVKVICCLLVVVSVIAVNISFRVTLNELNYDIAAATKSLSEAQSEATRLNVQLTAKISVANVRDYAENVLGMVKRDRYQVVYLNLDNENEIVPAG